MGVTEEREAGGDRGGGGGNRGAGGRGRQSDGWQEEPGRVPLGGTGLAAPRGEGEGQIRCLLLLSPCPPLPPTRKWSPAGFTRDPGPGEGKRGQDTRSIAARPARPTYLPGALGTRNGSARHHAGRKQKLLGCSPEIASQHLSHLLLGDTGHTELRALPLLCFHPLKYSESTAKLLFPMSKLILTTVGGVTRVPRCWHQSSEVPEHPSEEEGSDFHWYKPRKHRV